MKTIDADNAISNTHTEHSPDLLLKTNSNNVFNKYPTETNGTANGLLVQHPDYTTEETYSPCDARSQSVPHSLNGHTDTDCDIKSRLLTDAESPPASPSPDPWFKTWPERYDRNMETKPILRTQNGSISSKITLSEALQNISLAYSPITKQLHLLPDEKHTSKENNNINNVQEVVDVQKTLIEDGKRLGHRRNEAGSFSSTVSSLSNPSPSGSLLGAEERMSPIDDYDGRGKHTLSDFFTKSVFTWKPTNIFKKPISNHGSPQHHAIIASSSALIQNIRPSNLPAKTEVEEQRHREEYKAMVAAAKKKEAQTSAARQKQQKIQLQQEEQVAFAAKHFSQVVVPNWDTMCKTRKTRELWWQGLPSSVRGRIWRLAIGNELNVTQQLYEICLQRAQARLNSPESNESDLDQESSMELIQLDIARTFPNLCIFQEGGPYSDALHSLLAAYVCYRPDVGYVQGMSYIAAILILNMDELDAFICFSNLLNRPLHLAAFTLNQSTMLAYYSAYNETFNYNLPKLYSHFSKCGLTPDLYLLDWLYTVFAKAMPLDVACRVWDLFLRDGDEFIFRTALGVLHLNQDILMEMDFLHGAQFLTRLPEDLPADQLFKSIQVVNTNVGKQTFSQIVEKHKNFT